MERGEIKLINAAQYPTDAEARRQIIEVGRRMYEKNFVAANDGNISCRVSEDTIWTTPTGVSKGFMTEDMLVKMRMDGTVLCPGKSGPSSEVKMHIRIYQENPCAQAVCHAHPPLSTSFAIAGLALDQAIYPEALVNLGVVPCVHYELPGSQGIPDSVAPYAKDYNAVLLGNHGPVTWGRDLTEAWYRLEAVEHYAMITLYTRMLGRANVLSDRQIDALLAIRAKLGVVTGGRPLGAETESNLRDVVLNDAPEAK